LLDAELIETTVTAFLQRCAELETEGVPCLLLLEVDCLPADAQEVLRGFLAVPEFDLRTIATARAELSELANTQDYRADVAAMLSTVTIQMPGLSERLEDMPILLQYFVEELNAAGGHQVEGFSAEAVETLLQYPWPGNVDELIGIVREVHRKSEEPLIGVEELPKQIRLGIEADEYPLGEDETIDLDAFLQQVERELVQRAINQAKGNKAQAARLLGISRARLLRRLSFLGIESTGHQI
jgi:DNA-binding NtrC family response regulator